MKEHTRRQWEAYCAHHPELTGVETLVLFWLVHMHSAAERITRPGERRLAEVTHLANTTIARAMRTLTAKGAIRLVESHPKGGRKADEYAIPWLRDAPANAGINAGVNAGTSSPLTEERCAGAAHRERRRPAAVTGDAIDHPATVNGPAPDDDEPVVDLARIAEILQIAIPEGRAERRGAVPYSPGGQR